MGFDNECIINIQNLAGEYFCPVCRMLVYPNEALQSQCTHLYCKQCLTYVVATTRACPYDGYLVTQEDSKPLLESNKALAETIGKIAVHCLYHRSGCTWQGSLSDCSSHSSACAFGNSPVVCNRCAIQIMHRQVQEHALSCPGARAAEGAVSSTASTNTLQMQATVQGATVSSQAHASHITAAAPPWQVSSQSASPNPGPPLFTQAALPVMNLSHQQQYYQQYPGYDPYQQHYQQYYQQHYPQQLTPHPPLQPQPQAQSLHPPVAQSHVQTIPQQQPPSLAHPQPPAQIMPPAQHYPQSQAIDISQKQQPHPMIRPQSQLLPNQHQLHPRASQHSELHLQQVLIPHYQQSRPPAQPQPHIHLQAHLPVQGQRNSQVPQTWPPQAKYVNDYPSTSHMNGDHSYPLQSQHGLTQQSSGHSYPQGGPQQQQHPAQVLNQVSQQAIGQPLAPQYSQQVHPATHAPMYPLPRFNVPPPMPDETTQPRQNIPFPHNEQPYQSQSQVLKVSVQMQAHPVTTDGMNKTGLALSGSHQQSETWIRSDDQPQSAAEQQGGYFQPLVGSQSESKHMSAEDCPAKVQMEGRETSLVEEPSEVLLRMGASGNGVPSDENYVKKERVNDSVKHISVDKSGSATSDLKEGDPDEVKSKLMDSQSIQPATFLNSDIQKMVNPPSRVYAGGTSMPTGPVTHSRSSFDGIQPYLRHSGSSSETNFTPDGPKARPDSSFRGPRDIMLLEQGSQTILQEDRLLFPRPPDMESELFCKQERFFPSMPSEGDSLGFSKIPRPLGKALYGLHHDEHLQLDAFPKDNRLNLRHDVWSAASMYGRQLGVHYGSPDREHPNTSSHTIRYGTCSDFRLGTDGRDHNLFSPMKPLNLSSALAEFSLITSNVPPHLIKGSLGSFSGQARNAELSGNGIIRPPLSEMGSRSNFLLTEYPFHKRDLELYDNLRKRKAATRGWCRICKVDCDTVEGLDLHSQTREHQRMSMDMVMKIKQQNSKEAKIAVQQL